MPAAHTRYTGTYNRNLHWIKIRNFKPIQIVNKCEFDGTQMTLIIMMNLDKYNMVIKYLI